MLVPANKGAKGKKKKKTSDRKRQDAPVGAGSLFLRQPEDSGASWPLLAALTNYSVTQRSFLEICQVGKSWLQLCWISHREPPVPSRSLPLTSSSWSLLSAGYGWDTQLLKFSPRGSPRYLNPTQLKEVTALSTPRTLKQAPAMGLIQYVDAKSDSRKGGKSSAEII